MENPHFDSSMTITELPQGFKTVSGKQLLLGTGTGTKWKDLKRQDPANAKLLVEQIELSIKCGYYHLDTAEIYNTEPEVGKAMEELNVVREDFWVTTKYSPFSKTLGPVESLPQSLKNLGTSYVDLYLIHSNDFNKSSNGLSLEQCWREMIECQKSGLTRYIGVSNFQPEAIEKCIEISKEYGEEYLPRVNQMEFHPYLKNQFEGVFDLCKQNNILIEAYGPLTPIMRVEAEDHPLKSILTDLTAKYDKTDGQILLRWVWQKGVLPVTTSGNETRIKQSLDIYSFSLTSDEMKLIDEVEEKFQYRGFTFMV